MKITFFLFVMITSSVLTISAQQHIDGTHFAEYPQDGDGDWDHRGKDGHYHNPATGEVMPDSCDMKHDNAHPCHCARTVPNKSNCDTLPANRPATDPGAQCKTYCRKDDCHCHADCGS